jgi:hypothetical protein
MQPHAGHHACPSHSPLPHTHTTRRASKASADNVGGVEAYTAESRCVPHVLCTLGGLGGHTQGAWQRLLLCCCCDGGTHTGSRAARTTATPACACASPPRSGREYDASPSGANGAWGYDFIPQQQQQQQQAAGPYDAYAADTYQQHPAAYAACYDQAALGAGGYAPEAQQMQQMMMLQQQQQQQQQVLLMQQQQPQGYGAPPFVMGGGMQAGVPGDGSGGAAPSGYMYAPGGYYAAAGAGEGAGGGYAAAGGGGGGGGYAQQAGGGGAAASASGQTDGREREQEERKGIAYSRKPRPVDFQPYSAKDFENKVRIKTGMVGWR